MIILNKLKINSKKCILLGRDVKYLRHIVSTEGVTTDPEKIAAVMDWPGPHNKKHFRSFLEFYSYYRRFERLFYFGKALRINGKSN